MLNTMYNNIMDGNNAVQNMFAILANTYTFFKLKKEMK